MSVGFCQHGYEALGYVKACNFFRSRVTIITQGKLSARIWLVTLRTQVTVFSNLFMAIKTVNYLLYTCYTGQYCVSFMFCDAK